MNARSRSLALLLLLVASVAIAAVAWLFPDDDGGDDRGIYHNPVPPGDLRVPDFRKARQ